MGKLFYVTLTWWNQYVTMLVAADNESDARANAAAFLTKATVLAPFGFLQAQDPVNPEHLYAKELVPGEFGVMQAEAVPLDTAINNPNYHV